MLLLCHSVSSVEEKANNCGVVNVLGGANYVCGTLSVFQTCCLLASAAASAAVSTWASDTTRKASPKAAPSSSFAPDMSDALTVSPLKPVPLLPPPFLLPLLGSFRHP